MGFFSSSKPKVEQLSMLTPEQQSLLSLITGAAGGGVESLFGENVTDSPAFQQGMAALSSMLGDFDPTYIQDAFESGVADPARRAFQEQTIPGITERYAGSGGMRSSAMTGQILSEGANLESGLAGVLSNMLMEGQQQHGALQSQGISQALQFALAPEQEKQNLLALIQTGLGTQAFQNQVTPGKQSMFSQLAGPALGFGASMLTGGLASGALGILAGGGFGSGVQSFLGGN